MSWADEQAAIRARFTALSTVPQKAWDFFNEPWEVAKIQRQSPEASIWARLSVLPVPGAVAPVAGVSRPGRMGLGVDDPSYKEGLVTVQHFVPWRMEETALLPYVEETVTIFHRETVGGVQFEDAEDPERVGRDETKVWFQINVTIPFYVVR